MKQFVFSHFSCPYLRLHQRVQFGEVAGADDVSVSSVLGLPAGRLYTEMGPADDTSSNIFRFISVYIKRTKIRPKVFAIS